jgi:hypothetical protein
VDLLDLLGENEISKKLFKSKLQTINFNHPENFLIKKLEKFENLL